MEAGVGDGSQAESGERGVLEMRANVCLSSNRSVRQLPQRERERKGRS